jgi:hypothetical protein
MPTQTWCFLVVTALGKMAIQNSQLLIKIKGDLFQSASKMLSSEIR